MMASLARRFDAFWFAPAPATYLGVCRLLFFAWLFVWYWQVDFGFVAEYPQAFWTPLPLLSLLGLDDVPPAWLIDTLQAVWRLLLLLACVGLFTRSSIAVALVIGGYLLALTHSFHKINHSDAALVLAMAVLALSRCGDRWSLDAWWRRRRGERLPRMGGEYRWPVQMVRVLWAIVFVAAGWAKLSNSGWRWMFTDSFSNLIARNQTVWEPPLALGMALAEIDLLTRAMAVATIAFELAAPLALFSRLGRLIIVPGLLGMQIGIRLVMGDDFTQFMALYVFFVPWLWLGAWAVVLRGVTRRAAGEAQHRSGGTGKEMAT